MASFLAEEYNGWYPKTDEIVSGRYGKRGIIGRVLASKNNAQKPAIFSRYGFVGLYVVDIDTGKQRAILLM